MVLTNLLQPDLRNTYEQDYNRLGQVSFDAGNYQAARAYFERSLREHKNVQAMVNLGNALAVLGDRRGAGQRYEHAIAMDSTSHLAYYNLGNLAMESGEPRAAYSLWRRALACDPYFIPAHRNLALLLARAGRTGEAREHLAAWQALEPSPQMRSQIEQDIRMLNSAVRDTSAARGMHAP
jgi:tetratricopeptide (TPR) repeat protein